MNAKSAEPMYSNPVLNADWPDPDAVQVDGSYYLIASSINRAPGLPVLKSRNLVDWEQLGHALPHLPGTHYSLPRHGGGVWAPALRHHDGKFWIFYGDPDYGVYVLTALDAAGPWSEPYLLYAGRGIIDPCPLWDEDGQAYLIHGWAKSRSGVHNKLTLHSMAPDATRLLDAGQTVIDGENFHGCSTLEGPKFYKRHGWYWIFAPAGGVTTGWQSVFRSRSPFGPYEERRVLEQGTSTINGPHQGAWVTTPAGEDWFLHFQDRGPVGRVLHLQPMGWDHEGWPWMGEQSSGGGPGTPWSHYRYPIGTEPHDVTPAASDDFSSTTLGRQWHWQANPQQSWLTLPGTGEATLHPQDNDPINLRELPNVLSQILPGVECSFTTRVELDGVPVGTRAGILILGQRYAWLGIRQTVSGYELSSGTGGGTPHEDPLTPSTALPGPRIDLRIHVSTQERATFSWRSGASDWHELASEFQIVEGQWIGAELGIFTASPRGTAPKGRVKVGPVQVKTWPQRA